MSLFSARHARRAVLALALILAPAAFAQAPANPPPDAAPGPEVGAVASVDLASRPALTISGASDWDNGLQTVMDSLDKLRDAMAKAGLQPGGRPLSVFTETDDNGFKFTAMLPLAAPPAKPPTLPPGIQVAETPAGKAMKFEHRGSYDDIDTSYEAITAYLDEKGLEAQNLFIEEYLTTPKGSDDVDLEVDIYVFLK